MTPTWPPKKREDPLCGACGQRHPEGRGICELDPMTFIPDEAASDEEKRLRDALYALNNAILPDDTSFTGPIRNSSIEKARDEIWSLGKDLYGWKN